MKKLLLFSVLFLTSSEFYVQGAQEAKPMESLDIYYMLADSIYGKNYDQFVKIYNAHSSQLNINDKNHLLYVVLGAIMHHSEDEALPFIEFLLNQGLDIDQDYKNRKIDTPDLLSPLMRAAMSGYSKIVKLLLAHKIDKNLKNEQGTTAFDLAHEEYKVSVDYLNQLKAAGQSTQGFEQHLQRMDEVIKLLLPEPPTAPEAPKPSNLPGSSAGSGPTAGSGSNTPSSSSTTGGSTLSSSN